MIVVAFPNLARADKSNFVWGLGVFGGTQVPYTARTIRIRPTDKYDIIHFAVHPYVGWRWKDLIEFGLEGKLGEFMFKDNFGKNSNTFTAGITAMVTLDLIKFNELNRLYIGHGWGVAYWNNTPDKWLMNNEEWPIITQFDIGWKRNDIFNFRYIKIGYRFTHTSAAGDKKDRGVNSHGIMIGFYW